MRKKRLIGELVELDDCNRSTGEGDPGKLPMNYEAFLAVTRLAQLGSTSWICPAIEFSRHHHPPQRGNFDENRISSDVLEFVLQKHAEASHRTIGWLSTTQESALRERLERLWKTIRPVPIRSCPTSMLDANFGPNPSTQGG